MKKQILSNFLIVLGMAAAVISVFSLSPPRAYACTGEQACERAAADCTEKLGSWNGQTGTCIETPSYKCIVSGGDPEMMQTIKPGVPDGQELRCVCPDGKKNQNNICVESTSSSSSSNTTPQSLTKAKPVVDCDQPDLTAENCGIIKVINTIFNLVSGLVTLAVIGNIIFAGIQYSMAQGDPSTAAKAKTRIRNAIMAFLMYLVLYGFLEWLIPGGVFG